MPVNKAAVRKELKEELKRVCKLKRISPVPSLHVRFGSSNNPAISLVETGEIVNGKEVPEPSMSLGERYVGKYVMHKVWREYTSGYAYLNQDRISLTVGHSKQDRQLVLLHELAHIVEYRKRRDSGHGKNFWRTAKRLYEAAGVDMDYAVEREEKYRKRSAKILAG